MQISVESKEFHATISCVFVHYFFSFCSYIFFYLLLCVAPWRVRENGETVFADCMYTAKPLVGWVYYALDAIAIAESIANCALVGTYYYVHCARALCALWSRHGGGRYKRMHTHTGTGICTWCIRIQTINDVCCIGRPATIGRPMSSSTALLFC